MVAERAVVATVASISSKWALSENRSNSCGGREGERGREGGREERGGREGGEGREGREGGEGREGLIYLLHT